MSGLRFLSQFHQKATALASTVFFNKRIPRPSRTRLTNSRGIEREQNARFIDEIVVKPVGGRRVPVGERVEVYWVGSETPYDLTAYNAPEVDLRVAKAVAS